MSLRSALYLRLLLQRSRSLDKMVVFATVRPASVLRGIRYQKFVQRCVIEDARPSLKVTQLKSKQIKTQLFCLDMVTP